MYPKKLAILKYLGGNVSWNVYSGVYIWENSNSEIYMHPSIHNSIIYNSQDMEAMQMSIERWMDREYMVYICNGIILGHKKEWNNAICSTWMGLEVIILNEVNET